MPLLVSREEDRVRPSRSTIKLPVLHICLQSELGNVLRVPQNSSNSYVLQLREREAVNCIVVANRHLPYRYVKKVEE